MLMKEGFGLDTEILIKSARNGDKQALVKLIMLQKDQYYKLAYVYMKNEEKAMDALEDMIVILYENIHKLKDEKAFYSWSKTILVNCCKKRLKKSKREVPMETIENETYEENFEKGCSRIAVENHLSRLNEKHREVIRLRYFLDMDYKSISELLKIPVGTVKSRISTGLDKLKKSLEGELE